MFSENYSVCLNEDGSPREIARSGPVVTYKAIGSDSGRVVAMQLIPLASIDEVERVRFEENARTAQKLDNTNLAKVFDVGVEHDHFVFARSDAGRRGFAHRPSGHERARESGHAELGPSFNSAR